MAGAEIEQSVLFAEVSGSARLHAKLGESEALRAVDRCLKRIERVVEGFRGRVVKNAGDQVMAVFERVDDAFHAAIEMQQRIADLPPVSGIKLAIRVGFQHGAVIAAGAELSGESVQAAARLAALAKSGQVLINSQTQALLPPLLQRSTRNPDPVSDSVSATGEAKTPMVFEVLWQDADVLSLKAGRAPTIAVQASVRTSIRITYASQTIILDASRPALTMGRDADCDLLVHDRRASRQHARITLHGEAFILNDQSTNGTFITFADTPTHFLHRESVTLHGKGILCFAASGDSPEADYATFECL